MLPEIKSIPKWILIVSGLYALLSLIGVAALIFSPESVLEMIDLKAKGVDFLIHIWASRQFALAFIFAFSTLKKSVSMLTISYIFLLIVLIGDLFIGILQIESSLIISATAVSIFASVMIYFVNKQAKGNWEQSSVPAGKLF